MGTSDIELEALRLIQIDKEKALAESKAILAESKARREANKIKLAEIRAKREQKEIKRETKKKVKTDDMTKTQKSALTELRKIRRLKYITKEDFEMVKDKIENNKSVKLKYSKPDGTYRFSYKRIKGFGLS
jgi:hypothetical protein